jgi:HEAT repeat protein
MKESITGEDCLMDQEYENRLALLMKQLDQDDRVVRYEAVKELGQLRDGRAVEPLVRILKEEVDYLYEDDEEVWLTTLDALELIGEPSVAPLMELVDDLENDQEIRVNAIDLLASIGDPRAVELLIRCLDDEDSVVRYSAVYGLGKLGSEPVVEPLIASLTDKDEDVRLAAAEVLGELGDARAIPALQQALTANKRDIRDAITKALELIRSP